MTRLCEREVDEIMFSACQEMDCMQLYPLIDWSYSNRLTRRAGSADMQSKYIKLSAKLFSIATKEKQREVILHEVAHLAHAFTNDTTWHLEEHHGKEWQEFALLVGIPVSTECVIEKSDSITKHQEAFCDCSVHHITMNRRTRMVNGARYKCTLCNTELRLAR